MGKKDGAGEGIDLAPLAGPFVGAGEGNRTLMASLEGWSFTTKLHPLNSLYTLPSLRRQAAVGEGNDPKRSFLTFWPLRATALCAVVQNCLRSFVKPSWPAWKAGALPLSYTRMRSHCLSRLFCRIKTPFYFYLFRLSPVIKRILLRERDSFNLPYPSGSWQKVEIHSQISPQLSLSGAVKSPRP